MDCRGIFTGLPDDRCPCPEVIEPGQAYHMEPGHEPVYTAGTEVIEFSPTDKLDEVITVVLNNIGAHQPA
jgi:hypothetical protein